MIPLHLRLFNLPPATSDHLSHPTSPSPTPELRTPNYFWSPTTSSSYLSSPNSRKFWPKNNFTPATEHFSFLKTLPPPPPQPNCNSNCKLHPAQPEHLTRRVQLHLYPPPLDPRLLVIFITMFKMRNKRKFCSGIVLKTEQRMKCRRGFSKSKACHFESNLGFNRCISLIADVNISATAL